jgi:hypothetical protein
MGGAREAGARGTRSGRDALRRWPAVLVVAWACSPITADFDRIVAIEIVGSTSPTVEEGDTLRLHARAVSARGDTVPGAAITWVALEVDTGVVVLTIEASTGLVTALAPGSGRVQARIENLATGAITVTVQPAPDSISAVGDVRVPVDTAAAGSPPLTVKVVDLTTVPGDTLALGGKSVHFLTADPPPGSAAASGFFLSESDVPGADPHRVDTVSGTDGRASVMVVRVAGQTQPDSVAVDAVAVTARGDTVAGSPVRFWVLFGGN